MNIKKVMLLRSRRCVEKSSAYRLGPLLPPHSLYSIRASVQTHTDWTAEIHDFELPPYTEDEQKAVLKSSEASVFCVTSITYKRFQAINLIRNIRRLHPGAFIVAEGNHFSKCVEDSLTHIKELDAVVCGDGAIPLVGVLRHLDEGASLADVPNLVYREGGCIKNTPLRTLPAHDDDPNIYDEMDRLYSKLQHEFDWFQDRITVKTSFGCPGKCIYCESCKIKYRIRGVESVVDEIEHRIEKTGIRNIWFLDCTLTGAPTHAEKLLHEIINRKLFIKFSCHSRVDIPLHLLDLMRDAGCVKIGIGAESGSNPILKVLRKRTTSQQIFDFCKHAKSLGIDVLAMFMYSNPEETFDDIEQTLKLMVDLKHYARCAIQPALILPGTELERIAKERGVLPETFSWSIPYRSELGILLRQQPGIPVYQEGISTEQLYRVEPLYREMWHARDEEEKLAAYYASLSSVGLLQHFLRGVFVRGKSPMKYLRTSFLKRYFEKLRS